MMNADVELQLSQVTEASILDFWFQNVAFKINKGICKHLTVNVTKLKLLHSMVKHYK